MKCENVDELLEKPFGKAKGVGRGAKGQLLTGNVSWALWKMCRN